MKIFDEENRELEEENEFDGYSFDDAHSVFNVRLAATADEGEEYRTPLPENEQTVILFEPDVAGIKDGQEVTLLFDGNACTLFAGKKIGVFKEAFVKKLRLERGGQGCRAFYKADVPPMVRLLFGEGTPVPPSDEPEQP